MAPNIIPDHVYGIQNADTGNFLKLYENNSGSSILDGKKKLSTTLPEDSTDILHFAFIVHVVHTGPLTIRLEALDDTESIVFRDKWDKKGQSSVDPSAIKVKQDDPIAHWIVREGTG